MQVPKVGRRVTDDKMDDDSLWTFDFKTAPSATQIMEDIVDGFWHVVWFLIPFLVCHIFFDIFHALNGQLDRHTGNQNKFIRENYRSNQSRV